MPSPPELLIVGTGALACLFAARLAPLARVVMLGSWKAGLEAIKGAGIELITEDGSVRKVPVEVVKDPQACAEVRTALVLVKSWQTQRAADQLAGCLHAEGIALTLQNGKGNLEILQRTLGRERAALGVTTSGATLLGPGRVRDGGSGITHFPSDPRLQSLSDLMQEAGMVVAVSEDLEGLLWGKLAINAGINPLTALLRVPNGELLARPHTHSLMSAAAEEVEAVARALGVKLPYADAAMAVAEVARRTSSNSSSMLQDVRRGSPTEIDAICGEISRQGKRLGVPTPINWTLWYLVRSLEGEMLEEDE